MLQLTSAPDTITSQANTQTTSDPGTSHHPNTTADPANT